MPTITYAAINATCRACRGSGERQSHPNLPTTGPCPACQGTGTFLLPVAPKPA